ncbi:MAG: triphosphoribosyl-dephospho-CoA synthase [Sulfolobales archaeon]
MRYNDIRERLFIEVSVLLASGLSIEASVHKPGTTSPLKPGKDMYHHGFIIASSMISHAIQILMERAYQSSRCTDIGEGVKLLYEYGERIHGMGNLHLGFSILITPIALGFVNMYRRYENEDLESLKEALKNIDPLINESYDYLRVCGKISRAKPVLEIIKRISRDKIAIHSGPTPDVFNEGGEESIWNLIVHGRKVDLILLELYEKYRRTSMISKELKETLDKDLYKKIFNLFIDLSSSYIDTHIARRKSFLRAFIYRDSITYCISLENEEKKDTCIKALDQILRERNINPGSIADIIATAISLSNLAKHITHDPANS